MAEQLNVQVCYATPDFEFLRDLSVAPGTTIARAIELSGLLREVAGIDPATMVAGVYAKKKALDTVVRDHDRIEVYRPLLADPKDSRRRRAEKKGR